MNRFERWELEADLKAAKTKSVQNDVGTNKTFGGGIAAQLGIKKSKSIPEQEENSKRNKYQIQNGFQATKKTNKKLVFDHRNLKNNDVLKQTYKRGNECISNQVCKSVKKKCIEDSLMVEKVVDRQTCVYSQERHNMVSEWVSKHIHTNSNSEFPTLQLKRSQTKKTQACSKTNQGTFTKIDGPLKTTTNHISENARKIIRPATFIVKPMTNTISCQTEPFTDKNNTDSVNKSDKIAANTLFKVSLKHDEFITRSSKTLFTSKNENLSVLFSKIVDNLEISGQHNYVEDVNDCCFITINSRFKALKTMDLSHLELICEKDGTFKRDPVRIFTTLNRQHYEAYLLDKLVVPDLLITRLFALQ